jgi:hypothetical protein
LGTAAATPAWDAKSPNKIRVVINLYCCCTKLSP